MNSKMTTNSQPSTCEPNPHPPPKKKTKQTTKQEQNHRNGGHMEGNQWEKGEGRMGENGTGNKKHKW